MNPRAKRVAVVVCVVVAILLFGLVSGSDAGRAAHVALYGFSFGLGACVAGGSVGFAINTKSDTVISADDGNRVVDTLGAEDEVVGGGDLFNREMALITVSVQDCRQ